MGIEIKIDITASGRVHVTADGEDTKKVTYLLSGLGLDQSDVEAAMRRMHKGYRGPLATYGYELHITPESDDIEVTERSSPLAVASDTLRNQSSVSGTYSTTLREDITHKVTVTWSSNETATEGFEIGADLYIKGSGHMSFSTTTGNNVSKEKSEVVGSSRGVSVKLQPGQSVKANLMVKRRTVKVRVPFLVEIEGNVFGGYGPIEHQPIPVDLKDLLKKMRRPTSYRTEAVIEIVCFTDADVHMIDY